MESNRVRHHISQQFNAELEDIRSKVLAMGGMVERQIELALSALTDADIEKAEEVIGTDYKINSLEVAIDEECTHVLARRQPTAFDLRLIVAVIKTITDMERIGDQAERVARMAIHLAEMERPKNQYQELRHIGELVKAMVHDTLDAFARMDAAAAAAVARRDLEVDREYDGLTRQMITHMMEDPRNVRRTLDVLWSARALERIGDHARNMCEYIVYFVRGKDVRHTSLEQMEREARGETAEE